MIGQKLDDISRDSKPICASHVPVSVFGCAELRLNELIFALGVRQNGVKDESRSNPGDSSEVGRESQEEIPNGRNKGKRR